MRLYFERTDGVVVVTSCARVDGSNAKAFENVLRKIVQESDRALIIDFGPLKYISSTGLRAILVTAKELSAQGVGFGICALGAPIQRVFSIGVDKVVAVYETKEEAVASLSA